jgi:hypothetical protein
VTIAFIQLLPLVTDFEERTPSFYRDFYYEEVQTLLLSNEVSAAHATTATAGDPTSASAAAVSSSTAAAAGGPSMAVMNRGMSVLMTDGGDLSLKLGPGSAGAAEPTCLEKLWAHLRGLAAETLSSADVGSAEERTVCGSALAPMHAAGPPGLSENRTGGSVKLRVLVDYLLSLRRVAVTADATQFSLLLAMECAVPKAPRSTAPSLPVPTPPPGGENATSTEGAASSDPQARAEDYDLTCAEMRIDFQDYLELLCRVVGSPLWAHAGAGPASLQPAAGPAPAGDENHHNDEGQQQEVDQDQDSASVYSVHLSDVLAERLAVWKQTFDFDALDTAPAAPSSTGTTAQPEHQ